MKMKQIFLFIFACSMLGCTSQQLNSALGGLSSGTATKALTNDEIIKGLKEALVQGIGKGSDQASKLDGYLKNPLLKIPFPPETQKVETRLRQMGMGGEVDKFITSLNRGAEAAAKEAKPIFVSAITSMTVNDALGILKGEKNAATKYLRRTTETQLMNAFKPVVKKCLDQVNATKYYSDLVNTYNKIPAVEKVNPNLDDYASQKAIDGLFLLVEKEEENIRVNPVARTTEILKKVFAEAGK